MLNVVGISVTKRGVLAARADLRGLRLRRRRDPDRTVLHAGALALTLLLELAIQVPPGSRQAEGQTGGPLKAEAAIPDDQAVPDRAARRWRV